MKKTFWEKVDMSGGIENCWPWLKSKIKSYGQTWDGKNVVLAHRMAWSLVNGPIPEGAHIRHSCDNPPCCNPAHLEIGTHADNMRDMAVRGRAQAGADHWSQRMPERVASGDRNGSRTHPEKLLRGPARSDLMKKIAARGDSNGSRKHPERLCRGERATGAKLTEEKVREIRTARMSGEKLQFIAQRFGVKIPTVSEICNRRKWAHVL
jgi:hypothetical protein